MTQNSWMRRSDRWAALLLRFYPADFRDEMGQALIEAYRDRCRVAFDRGGVPALALVWLSALVDSIRNGIGERLRPAVAWRRSGNWGLDAQRAVRRLTRAPMFTATMIATLTVGLGAFAVVYTVVAKVLLAPLPYERPNDLYFVWRNYTWVQFGRGWVGGPDVAALKAAGGVIGDAVGLRRSARTLTRGGGGEPAEVNVMLSTPNLFDVLGVRPAHGRGFAPEEYGEGHARVVVLGDALWRDRFGADPAILGSQVRLDGDPFTVIGIMPPGFRFMRHTSDGPPEAADAYTTFAYDLAQSDPKAGAFAVLVRAKPGTSPEALNAAVGSVGAMIDRRDFTSKGLVLYAVGAKADLVARVRPALVVLGAAGAFLVVVLAVNLATLLLARAAQREREYAVTRALGANPVALARATLFEGGILGTLGGMGGVVLAVWGTQALVTLAPADLPRREAIGVDWWIATAVVGVGAALGFLAATLPALWATRAKLVTLLASAAVRGGGGHGRMRRAMVVVQVALSLVLLTTGGLVVRSFERLLRADPGFESRGVLTLRVPVPGHRYPNLDAATALHERLERAIAEVPGVTTVGAASALPLTAGVDQTSVRFPAAPGNTGDPEHDSPLVDYIPARGRYFSALGIHVLAGRAFEPTRQPGVREAMIDRTLAAQFFPGGSPIGATVIADGSDTLKVVGVVEHARQYDLHKDGRSQIYIRNEDNGYGSLSFAVRSERAPLDVATEVAAAVRRADPELAVSDVRPMDEIVNDSRRQQRLSAVLITGFSIGALMLAAMGLFGIVAASVSRRRHEIAVRLALGADHGNVRRLVVREGGKLVLLGMLVGVPGVYFMGRAIAGVLVGVSPFDAPTLAAIAAGLVLVALVACYIPARRVTAIAPAQALRDP
ncbi:MAG TPA: ADOP family duplicated permease [Gemmatimonadaceae bacterium]|jgi:putative ABC transport system permease protein|nr:ADOP family duplicated permease [Gemmatimonadaceae bacterium]